MTPLDDVVITGLGVVSPIGIGVDTFWQSLVEGRSGVRPLTLFDASQLPVRFGGEVQDFDPKVHVKPRKSLKVMSRDIQLGFAAADQAFSDAGLGPATIDPERMGVLFGTDMIQAQPDEMAAAYRACFVDGRFDFQRWGQAALAEIYPLWMLKHLPNMPACHIAIFLDARGPNNSIAAGEVSSLLAIAEASRVIERGQADVMIGGGTGSLVHPTLWVRQCASEMSHRHDDPAGASRPFDANRDGAVGGEGAAAFVLERRKHAERRGAKILGRIVSYYSTFGSPRDSGASQQAAIERSIRGALEAAKLEANHIGHVNAHGLSTVTADRIEAQAIHATMGSVPVTAPKSFFGNLGSGTGAVEMMASVLGLRQQLVPATLNYQTPDPQAPVNVVRGEPLGGRPATALLLNQTPQGQAVAMIVAG
jgi:3-oxoacyl-[acyl-carrier-protein] synthase II